MRGINPPSGYLSLTYDYGSELKGSCPRGSQLGGKFPV
jgi:hypothetical protein